ncbi:MAG: hypothetical protein CMP21_07615 [Rickettsiales bacterium]|nr:hypothetical protein [Rickettsiales bacterium]
MYQTDNNRRYPMNYASADFSSPVLPTTPSTVLSKKTPKQISATELTKLWTFLNEDKLKHKLKIFNELAHNIKPNQSINGSDLSFKSFIYFNNSLQIVLAKDENSLSQFQNDFNKEIRNKNLINPKPCEIYDASTKRILFTLI